ncbi:putative quinate permease [Neolecta irregularis DAH-3]|uniref:Putative quinate permease n=1 Tax=Neolecta irregularis (strain DAH-3) TaxID=1198029 RepID=A0A1U7LHM8_NEOID|nr:putative quinate permease [Neolecta irregularis DAH-3]|eukprot:OLL22031.1 putative quinate permease [Neolecta irregularis DAH-3]
MIFKDLGLNSTRSSLFVTGLYGIAKFITTAVFLISVVETLGRRRSLIWTAFAQGFMMFYVAAFIALKDPHPREHVSAPGIIAVIAIFMFVSFYSFGWG